MHFESEIVPEVVYGDVSLADLASRISADQPTTFLVSESLMGHERVRGAVLAVVHEVHAELIVGVPQHLPYQRALEIGAALRSSGARVVVAIGGGSVLDAARLAGLAASTGATTTEELHAHRHRVTEDGPSFAPQFEMSFIAVPTTLSAAELSPGVAATEPSAGVKHIFISPSFAFDAVLVDLDLSITTPPQTWVTSGYRAIDHAVESIISRNHRGDVDRECVDALRELPDALILALARPSDTSVRLDGHIAAWKSYGGVAHGTLGLSHAMGHQLGPLLGISHGATSALTLPAVVAHYANSPTVRWSMFAEVLGGSADADSISQWLTQLAHDLGLPTHITEQLAEPQRIAAAVLGDPVAQGAPDPLPSEAELTQILVGLQG